MNEVLDSVLIFLMILVLGCCHILFRNEWVCSYRIWLINQIAAKNVRELEEDPEADGSWRWDMFRSISYGQMLYKVWKPLGRFYDRKFLRDLEK